MYTSGLNVYIYRKYFIYHMCETKGDLYIMTIIYFL